jgi:hypothetical protein
MIDSGLERDMRHLSATGLTASDSRLSMESMVGTMAKK